MDKQEETSILEKSKSPEEPSLEVKLLQTMDPAMKRLYETILASQGIQMKKENSEDDENEEKEEPEPVVKIPKRKEQKRKVVEDLTPDKLEIAKGILISDWSLLTGDLKRAAARVCYRGGFDLFKHTDAPKVIRLIRQMRRQYHVKRIPGTNSWTSPS